MKSKPTVHFGTDGVRGIANRELTPELALLIGRAVAGTSKSSTPAKILVGKDPRLSSDMLEAALLSGIASTGGHGYRAGILPTPAISIVTRIKAFDAGIMISASHNPVEDNGIKIFSSEGLKLSDSQEKEIESHLNTKHDTLPRPIGTEVGQLHEFPEGGRIYVDFLKSRFPHKLKGLKIVLDCAYGATSVTAPELFESLQADVVSCCAVPDGSKINVQCGATHLAPLQNRVLQEKADLGIAFDGDGDRVIFIDDQGGIFNGDSILASLALHWQKQGKLRGPVVTTVMANFGLEQALSSQNISFVRTPVGDRFVLEEMLRANANLGGEQSGHVIILDESPSGDGVLTALQILSALIESRKRLSDLATLVKEFPQILLNVRVSHKNRFHKDVPIQKAIETEAARLLGRGRIVVRPSGTEPIVRVMAEGPDKIELEQVVQRVAKTIQMRLS